MARLALRVGALAYLGLLLLLPLSFVGFRAFEHGLGPVWEELSSPAFVHALELTLLVTAVAVPANTVFGVLCALAVVRSRLGLLGSLLGSLVALPLALSPVVVGLSLVLVYGKHGWLGGWLLAHGVRVIFATPGIVLATIIVSLPFVAREVAPVLEQAGVEQEEAAFTLGASAWTTFRRITLPSIRWAIVYGVVLTTARALGEYGAVAVVSGRIAGATETLTLHVDERFQSLDPIGMYVTALVLAALAVATLLALNLTRKETLDGDRGTQRHEALR